MQTNERTAPVSKQPDQNTISLDLMSRMKMHGMAEAFRESLAGTTAQSMTPDTFLSMLLSREWDYRAQAAVARMTKNAAFRYTTPVWTLAIIHITEPTTPIDSSYAVF